MSPFSLLVLTFLQLTSYITDKPSAWLASNSVAAQGGSASPCQSNTVRVLPCFQLLPIFSPPLSSVAHLYFSTSGSKAGARTVGHTESTWTGLILTQVCTFRNNSTTYHTIWVCQFECEKLDFFLIFTCILHVFLISQQVDFCNVM